MDSFVQRALITFCSDHQIFGESSEYLQFNEAPADCEEDGLRSQRLFGHIVYRTPAEEHQISPPIMLKIMPKLSKLSTSLLEDYFNELFFYTRVMPVFQHLGDLQPLLPKFYDSHIQVSTGANNFLLIFEDLRRRGFCTHQRHSFLDVEHLSLMLRKLGNFHSFSYKAKLTNPHHFHSLGRLFCNQVDVYDSKDLRKCCQRGLHRLRWDSQYSHRLTQVEEVLDNAGQLIEKLNTSEQDQPLSVLCHGDFIRGNVLFRYENGQPVEMKMIDMASCRVAAPVADLCTVLYLNANQRTRDKHWDRLIDSYCAGLQEVFGSKCVPSRNSIMEAFCGRALYGYIIASYFLHFTVAIDAGMPSFDALLPKEYKGKNYNEIPEEVRDQVLLLAGGEECTDALADILRDIINRGFVCS